MPAVKSVASRALSRHRDLRGVLRVPGYPKDENRSPRATPAERHGDHEHRRDDRVHRFAPFS